MKVGFEHCRLSINFAILLSITIGKQHQTQYKWLAHGWPTKG